MTAAFLAGAPLIACAQGGTTKDVAASGAANGATAATAPVAATSPADSGPAGSKGSATGGGSLMPCREGPPYTSLPCIPVRR
jgi:hypothetical protein